VPYAINAVHLHFHPRRLHVAYSFNNYPSSKFYLNGAAVTSTSVITSPISSIYPLTDCYISKAGLSGNSGVQARFKDFRIFNVALT
jgi:hypothetical protein